MGAGCGTSRGWAHPLGPVDSAPWKRGMAGGSPTQGSLRCGGQALRMVPYTGMLSKVLDQD